MIIRKTKIEDAKEISELVINTIKDVNSKDINEQQFKGWLKSNTLEKMKEKLAQKSRNRFVIIDNDEIVGYLAMFLEDSSLASLYIKHDVISKGYGKKLLQFAEEFAENNNIDELKVDSSRFAFNFYKSQGYITIKESIVDVNGAKIPVIEMKKKL